MTKKYISLNIKIVATALVLSLGFSACSDQKNGNKNASAQQRAAIPVNIFTVTSKKEVTSKEYSTIIKPVEVVTIQARVQGILEKKFFNEGDYIKKGDKLYAIEDDTYLANLNQSKANFDKANKDFKRAVVLFKTKSISDQNYEEFKFAYEDAKARLEQAQIEFDYTKVISPIDGIAGIKQFDVGNLVVPNSTNSTLVTITRVDPVHAEFSLPIEDVVEYLGQLQNGTATITLDSMGKTYQGVLDYVSPTLDSNTDTLLVRAKFQNKDRGIIVGSFTKVKLNNLNLGEVFVIPETSILKTSKGTFVYVVDENSSVQIRPIEIGILVKDGVVIKKGLKANDKVITTNIAKVRQSSIVQIVNSEKM